MTTNKATDHSNPPNEPSGIGQTDLSTQEPLDVDGRSLPVSIDATGLVCPLPLLKLKQALHHLAPGASLVLSIDDPNSVRDTQRFCAKLGYEFRAKPDDEQRTICHLWVTKPTR